VRYGYIPLKLKGAVTYFIFYLFLGRSWKQISSRCDEEVIDKYQVACSGMFVEVVMEEGNPSHRLQLLGEVEGENQWCLIYWLLFGGWVLLSTSWTTSDPYLKVIWNVKGSVQMK
jgi:hypothetical protein